MSDEIRKDGEGPVTPDGVADSEFGNGGGAEAPTETGSQLPDREKVLPRDHELYTPQGGGSGTGAGPIQEVQVAERASEVVPVTLLPVVTPEDATSEALGRTTDGGSAGPGAPPEEKEVSSFRLLSTLAVAGMIAGALLVFVFLWSDPLIKAEQARVLREAVGEVLKGPAHFESIFIEDGQMKTTAELTAGVDTMDLDKVFLGYDENGDPVGFAMVHARFGFQDLVQVIFGYDAQTRQVLGMKVLDHSETPGLGTKIEEMPFVGEFNGVDAPIDGVKPDRNTGAGNQVDMITGVTISSRAVVRTINERIDQLADLLAAYEPTSWTPPTPGAAEPESAPGVAADTAGATGGEEEDR